MLRPLFMLTLMIFALSACQQAAWKAGANADDLKRDEQTCRTQTPEDDAAIKQCLRGKGWTVAEFRAPAEDENAEPAADITPATTQPVAPPLHPAIRDKPTVVENADKSSANSTTTIDTNSNTAPRAPQDPLQRQSVQTWWKAGAQAADFDADANACLQQLGEQHTPDYAQHLYTRAMVKCLTARGWFAGHDPVYTPLRAY